MQPSKVLIFDLCPQSGLATGVKGLLEAHLPGSVRVKVQRFDSPDIQQAAAALASALARIAPRHTFLILEPKCSAI